MRKINPILLVAGAMLLITLLALGLGWHPNAGVSAASCSVSGVISTDTTWSPATCDQYVVTASVVVPSGVTLTIEAGTTVKFDFLKGLLVQGTLVARGTSQNPITFTSNQGTPARGDWGEIHFTDSSTDATFDGSGNYAAGSIVQYAIVEYAGSAGTSGALQIEASSPYIDHNTIRNNGAKGINASGNGALRATDNIIMGNKGSGIYAEGAATISNNTITGNTGGGIYGGGIYIGGTATISNNTISNNTGGGIGARDAKVTISNNTITGNSAGDGGSGIWIYGGTATISNNTITNNTNRNAIIADGGGIRSSGTVTISANTITGNSAGDGGGGISASGTETIIGNTISNNTASYGGGIYIGGTATISNNTITGNSASYRGGGISLDGGSRPTINNNDLYGNMAGSPPTPSDLYNGNGASRADVNAENNYWGTTGPTVIEDHIWHFLDDSSLGLVDYTPFRTTPVGTNPTPTPTATLTPTPTAIPTPTPTPPQTFSRTFDNPGAYPYNCFFHRGAGMVGTITVIAPTSPTATPTPTSALPTATPTVTAETIVNIEIMDNRFSPQNQPVSAGSTVVWTNKGNSPHTATSDTGLWDSGALLGQTPTPTPTPTLTPTPTAMPMPTPTPTPTPTPAPTIPNLSVMKIASKEKAFPGDAFTYLLFLENSGPTGITVALTDTIPTGASYITNTVWGGAVHSPTINAALWSGTVQPGASTLPSQVFQFRVRIDPDVSTNAITNTVLVSDDAVTTSASVMTEVWRRIFAPLVVKQASGW